MHRPLSRDWHAVEDKTLLLCAEETGNQIQMEMQSYEREICAIN